MDKKDCNHCWHPHTGPLMMVIKEGHVVQSCCKCQAVSQVHLAHAYQGRRLAITEHGRVGCFWGALTPNPNIRIGP